MSVIPLQFRKLHSNYFYGNVKHQIENEQLMASIKK